MKNSHMVASLLLMLTGLIFIQKNSQQTNSQQTIDTTRHSGQATNANNPIAENKDKLKEAYAHRIKDHQQSPIIVEPNPPSQTASEKTVINFGNAETPEEEPTKENATVAATGEFADEINFPNKENDCAEYCDAEDADITGSPAIADGARVNTPAEGEHADQINADAIFTQARQKNPALQPKAKLVDVPTNSAPSTEPGAYSPPQ